MAEPASKKIVLRETLSPGEVREIAHNMLQLLMEDPGPGMNGWAIDGQAIFLGAWQPRSENGHSLGTTFNVFAAPEDLPDLMTYSNTVKHVAGLQKWHGYDGSDYADDKELRASIRNGSYAGGWIIPPLEILWGVDAKGTARIPDNLSVHKDKGAFKGTFKAAANMVDGHPECYLSSSVDAGWVRVVRLLDGAVDLDHVDTRRMSCRLVRLVEQKV